MRRRFDFGNDRGQTLIWVAIALVVLLGFVALAIDVGSLYGERRKMQNAADAGALAGAQELCFGTGGPAAAEAKARQYATLNTAESGQTTVDVAADPAPNRGGTVTVTAGTNSSLYFASLFAGNTTGVVAQAAATCGGASRLCGLMPITFSWQRWQNIPCGATFYVINDDRIEEGNYNICDRCTCPSTNPPDGASYIIGPGQRTWVNFPRPGPLFPDPYGCANNCGGQQVQCMIEHNYGGQIDLSQPVCLPGQAGVNDAALQDYTARNGDIVNILLWDRACSVPPETSASTCNSNSYYHVMDTGCIQVIDMPTGGGNPVDTVSFRPPKAGYGNNDCPANVKVGVAKKMCNCVSQCGTTTGQPCGQSQVCAVSLTK